MSSQGPFGPSTGANVTGIGTVAWQNPGNITVEDGTNATRLLNNSASNWLQGTGFGFSVSGTVNGFLLEVKRKSGTFGNIVDNAVRLVKAGTIQTPDKADGATQWPGSLTYKSYGGPSDLWSGTWTAADANNANFGAAVSAVENSANADTAYVDYMRITATFTVSGKLFMASLLNGLGAGGPFFGNPIGCQRIFVPALGRAIAIARMAPGDGHWERVFRRLAKRYARLQVQCSQSRGARVCVSVA